MIEDLEIMQSVEEFNGQEKEKEKEKQTYAELIAHIFKDKYIEIYLGDSYEEVSIEQISSAYPAVFCGKVLGAFKECLIIKAIHVESKTKNVKDGGVLFINERGIRALTEVGDGRCLQDMMLRSIETNAIYNAYLTKTKIKIRP